MATDDYKSEHCEVSFLSELAPQDAEKLIGKVVARVDAFEYSLRLTFTDGSSVVCKGNRWDGCSMGVEYEDA